VPQALKKIIFTQVSLEVFLSMFQCQRRTRISCHWIMHTELHIGLEVLTTSV